MSESRWITVHNEADVINARLQTRQMAKDAGLQIMDQARISLAVSSLAHMVRLGDSHPGQIIINRIAEEGRSGVQVVWILKPDTDYEDVMQALDDTALAMMVDDVNIQTSPVSGLYITAVKWCAPAVTGIGR